MTNYKVGDKVRILDVDAIDYGDKYWENGDVVEVALVEYGEPLMLGTKPGYTLSHMYISEDEFHAIELVEETPKLTKKARIEALEKANKEQADFNEATADDFADLFGRVEALEKRLDEKNGDAITSVNDVKLGDKVAVEKGFSEYLRANSSYEVVAVSSGNSEYGSRIVILDDDGDDYNFSTNYFAKLRKVAS